VNNLRTGARAVSLGAACTLATLGMAASAPAATFCVPAHGGQCAGTDEPTIQAAITAASNNNSPSPTPDVIKVAAGTYHGPFSVQAGNPLTLTGAGDTTVLDDPAGGDNSITLAINEGTTRVESLKVLTPPGNATTALFGGAATHVSIGEAAGSSGATGVSASSFDRGTISLTDPSSTGAATFVATISRSRITAGAVGIRVTDASAVDDVVRVTAPNGTALLAEGAFDSGAHLVGRQLTLVASPGTGATGVDVEASPPIGGVGYGASSQASLDGVVLRGFATDVQANGLSTLCGLAPYQSQCTYMSTVTLSYSNYDPAKAHDNGYGTVTDGTGNLHAVDPHFVNAAGGNFDLAPGSPLIDSGDPAAPPAGDPTADVLDRPRKVDGNFDGSPVIDMGAFEWQVPPKPVAVIRAPSVVVVGRPVRFDGTASHDPAHGQLTFSWRFGDGNQATGLKPAHTYGKTGTYTVRLVVSSSSGAPSATAVKRIVVSRSPLCVVPRLRGKTLPSAGRALRHAHCRLGHVGRSHSMVARGHVIRSKPAPGTRLAHNGAVAVVLSHGR
jgi:hypothetical protein